MKKIYILLIISMWMLSSCVIELAYPPTPEPPTALPPVTPNSLTHNPPYVHYSPPEEIDIYIEFDYPDYWIYAEDMSNPDSRDIVLWDPRFFTLPTPYPGDNHPPMYDFPSVRITIWGLWRDDMTFDSFVQDRRQTSKDNLHGKLIDDYNFQIDENYRATILETQYQMPEVHLSPMFSRTIFIFIQGKIYEIDFEIAEHERGSEFEQGYEYFINSIKITQ